MVYRRNLKLSTGAGLDVSGYIDDAVGIEVKTYDGVIAPRVHGFFFDAQAVAVFVKLGNAVAFRVIDVIAEDRSLALFFGQTHALVQHSGEA